MTAEVKALNCTACGAALTLHGGHRVRAMACSYCGTVMDAHEGYRVVQQLERQRLATPPFSLGMAAKLRGVTFTIIGLIEYTAEETEPWLSFQLFSPTHGYAWLTWDADGHFLFSRRVRGLPMPALAEGLAVRDAVLWEGRRFELYESYLARISYVEGEFTWLVQRGDTVRVSEAIAPPFLFEYEQTPDEVEYSLGEYLPAAEVYAAFGLEPPAKPQGIHPAQPFEPGPLPLALAKVGPIFVGVALFGLIVLALFGGGRPLLATSVPVDDHPGIGLPFSIDTPDQLLRLSLSSKISDPQASYNVAVTRGLDDQVVLKLGTAFDDDLDDEDDSGDRRRASALFRLPEAGNYTLKINSSWLGDSDPEPLTVELNEGVYVWRYVVGLLILAGIAVIWLPLQGRLFAARRWSGSGTDDDD